MSPGAAVPQEPEKVTARSAGTNHIVPLVGSYLSRTTCFAGHGRACFPLELPITFPRALASFLVWLEEESRSEPAELLSYHLEKMK